MGLIDGLKTVLVQQPMSYPYSILTVIVHNGTETRAIQVNLGSSSEFWTIERISDPDLKSKAPANYVPAAAGTHMGLAYCLLIRFTACGNVNGYLNKVIRA